MYYPVMAYQLHDNVAESIVHGQTGRQTMYNTFKKRY